MSGPYVAALVAIAVVGLGSRLFFAALPIRRLAAPLTVADTVLVCVGAIGLLVHCAAMFFRSSVARLPGTGGAIRTIDAFGTASMIWYGAAAVLVLLGLRRQHPVAIGAAAAALAGVGFTMFDGGPLHVHLAAIIVSAVVLAAIGALLVIPPWSPSTEMAHN